MENVIFVQHGFSSTTIYHTLKLSEIKEKDLVWKNTVIFAWEGAAYVAK